VVDESAPAAALSTGVPQAVRRRRHRRLVAYAFAILLAYFLAAYLLAPFAWKRHFTRHPALDDMPGITRTGSGIPGDPINVALIGSKSDVVKIMLAAKWDPADPLSWRSSMEIAAATVLRRPYPDAPVSNLFLFGRKEDLAFEQPVGHDPKKRHHVRFWNTGTLDEQGRLIWIGAATFDTKVGFSHTTGQITHHIDGNVDAERDHLFENLRSAGDLAEDYAVPDFHVIRMGHNGGGDLWKTDGQLFVGVIEIKNAPQPDVERMKP
jgi:LssY C-terminus